MFQRLGLSWQHGPLPGWGSRDRSDPHRHGLQVSVLILTLLRLLGIQREQLGLCSQHPKSRCFFVSLMRSSSTQAPRACPGGMEEVLCSPVSREEWLGTTWLEVAEQKKSTDGYWRGHMGAGRRWLDRRQWDAGRNPLHGSRSPNSISWGGHPWGCTLWF